MGFIVCPERAMLDMGLLSRSGGVQTLRGLEISGSAAGRKGPALRVLRHIGELEVDMALTFSPCAARVRSLLEPRLRELTYLVSGSFVTYLKPPMGPTKLEGERTIKAKLLISPR